MNRYCLNLLSALLFPVFLWAQGDSIVVHGHIKGDSGERAHKLTLTFKDKTGKSYAQTAAIQGENFAFRVPKQVRVQEATLRLTNADPANSVLQRPLNLFIGMDDIKIEGHLNELDLAIVSGGIENGDYNALRQSTADLTRSVTQLYGPMLEKDPSKDPKESESIYAEIAILHRQEAGLHKEFIRTHPDSYVSLFLLNRMKNRYTSDGYAQAYAALGDGHKKTRIAQAIYSNIQRESLTKKGTEVFAFERTTMEGKPFHIADLKGQVFLLDFWGSWCAPCRASMPHLIDLHNRYKEKGFEIVGIAQEYGKTLEQSQVTWKKAVDELGIHWINVLNNENKETSDIVALYGVTGFPTKILVDEQGKIILRVTASATDDIDVALKKIYGF